MWRRLKFCSADVGSWLPDLVDTSSSNRRLLLAVALGNALRAVRRTIDVLVFVLCKVLM